MIPHGGIIVHAKTVCCGHKNGAHVGVKNVGCWQTPIGQVFVWTVGHGGHENICVGCWQMPAGQVSMCTVGHGGADGMLHCPIGHVCICTVGHGGHDTCHGCDGWHCPGGHVCWCTVGHGGHDMNPGSVG